MRKFRDWWFGGAGSPAPPTATPRRLLTPRQTRDADDGLQLLDDPPDPARTPKHWRRSGFDPYASDGGYGRSHAWERLERD